MEAAVVGDEVLAVAGKAAESVQRLQYIVIGVPDRLSDAGGLERKAETQQVARIGKRDRIDAIALPRLHRDEVLALEPQQRLTHRLAADRIALGELLLAHIIARREPASQDIRAKVFVDIVTQQH